MSRLEALRTELDAIRFEKQRLEAENARLRDSEQTAAAARDGNDGKAEPKVAELEEEHTRLVGEYNKLTKLYEGVLRETQREQESSSAETNELKQKISELEERQEKADILTQRLKAETQRAELLERDLEDRARRTDELEAEFEQQLQRTELERLRAVAEEREKSEAREGRLLAVLEQVQRQLDAGGAIRGHLSDPVTYSPQTTITSTPVGVSPHTPTERESTTAHLLIGEGEVGNEGDGDGGGEAGGARESEPVRESGNSHTGDRVTGSHPLMTVRSPYMA